MAGCMRSSSHCCCTFSFMAPAWRHRCRKTARSNPPLPQRMRRSGCSRTRRSWTRCSRTRRRRGGACCGRVQRRRGPSPAGNRAGTEMVRPGAGQAQGLAPNTAQQAAAHLVLLRQAAQALRLQLRGALAQPVQGAGDARGVSGVGCCRRWRGGTADAAGAGLGCSLQVGDAGSGERRENVRRRQPTRPPTVPPPAPTTLGFQLAIP